MERDVRIDGLAELLAVSTMTLATTGADGQPHAAPVYYAASSLSSTDFSSSGEIPATWEAPVLYFFSDPQSQHGQDIASNPHIGIAIYPPCYDWQDIRGLQMRGVVKIIEKGAIWERGWELYQAKFPFTSSLKEIVVRNTMYSFLPSWLRLVDNRKGFGFKQEWEHW